MSEDHSIAVIGAGITGITTAYKLAKRGSRVTIFDRHPYAAMETSFANGGQLSASNAEVWNSWATVWKGIKWMTTPGAPLLVSPKPSWHKLSWMMEFIGSIPKYEENTVTTVRMAIEAREHLRRMAADEGIDFDCENRGILHFYHTKKDFEAAARVTALLAKGGLRRRPSRPPRSGRSNPRCAATTTAASTPRAISPATSTSSPTAWPRPASDWVSRCGCPTRCCR